MKSASDGDDVRFLDSLDFGLLAKLDRRPLVVVNIIEDADFLQDVDNSFD